MFELWPPSTLFVPDGIAAFVEDARDDRGDVRWTLTEPSHEVWEPLPSKRNINADTVSAGDERRLQVAPHAVQQLKLILVRTETVFGGPFNREGVHSRVVRGDRRVLPAREESLHQPCIRIVDFRFVLVSDGPGFLVSALDESYPRA